MATATQAMGLKYVPFGCLKILENMPMPWISQHRVDVIQHVSQNLTIISSVPKAIPPIYIAQWAAIFFAQKSERERRRHFKQVTFPPFDDEEPPTNFIETLLDVDPPQPIILQLNPELDAAIIQWFFDPRPPKSFHSNAFRKWNLPSNVLANLYRVASILIEESHDPNTKFLYETEYFLTAKNLNFQIPGGPRFQPMFNDLLDVENRAWSDFDNPDRFKLRHPLGNQHRVSFPHLYNDFPRMVYFPTYHHPASAFIKLDSENPYFFDFETITPISAPTSEPPLQNKLGERDCIQPHSENQPLLPPLTPWFSSAPLYTNSTNDGLLLAAAPTPFNRRSGQTSRPIDIPLVRSWYSERSDRGEPLDIKISKKKLLKYSLKKRLRYPHKTPTSSLMRTDVTHKQKKKSNNYTIPLTTALSRSKYFRVMQMDWLQAATQLITQAHEMMNLVIIKKKVVYLHLDYNFTLKTTKTLSTKERKKSRFGNAFHLTREILKLTKFVVDAHVKFRLGNIDAFRLADALFHLFLNWGEITAIYRYKYKVMHQVRQNKDLAKLIMAKYASEKIPDGPGVGFWAPLWRTVYFFLLGVTPRLEKWIGNLISRQYRGRKFHKPVTKITKQRVESHFDIELKHSVSQEILDTMPPSLRGKNTNLILKHLNESWRCWKANIPWKVPGMPPPLEAIILRYVKQKADWWTSIAHYNRERILRGAPVDRTATRKNLGRMTRLLLMNEHERQTRYMEHGPFLNISHAVAMHNLMATWLESRKFELIPFPATNFEHNTRVLKLALEQLKERYGHTLRLSSTQRRELALIEKAFENPNDVLIRIKRHLLQQRTFADVELEFLDMYTVFIPVHDVIPIEKITDAFLDQYLWYQAHVKRLFPNWVQPADDTPVPVLVHKWCSAINNYHQIYEHQNGEYVVILEATLESFFQNIDLTFYNRMLRLVVDHNIANYMTAKNNVKISYKDMEHTNYIGLIRGIQFSSFIAQFHGLLVDLLILGKTRASEIAGPPTSPNRFLSFSSIQEETNSPIRGYQRYVDKVHILAKFTAEEASGLVAKWTHKSGTANNKPYPSKLCWSKDIRMRLLTRDTSVGRAFFWSIKDRLPPSVTTIDWDHSYASVYSSSNPSLFFSISDFEVRIFPKTRIQLLEPSSGAHGTTTVTRTSTTPDPLLSTRHLQFVDKEGVWNLINKDSCEITAQAHLRVSDSAIQHFSNRIRQILVSSGATTFTKIANKWNSAILGLLVYFREAIPNTPKLVEVMVKSEHRIQNRIKMGLNSKMPARFPPVVFYTPKELGGLGMLSVGYILIDYSDLRYARSDDDPSSKLFIQGLSHKEGRMLPTVFRYITPWETEIQDSITVWTEYSIKRQEALAENRRITMDDMEDAWGRGIPRINTLFQPDRKTLAVDKGWRVRLEFRKHQHLRYNPYWWTSRRHDGKLWNLSRYREDVIASLGGMEGILEHTLFKATYFPSMEGLFWERASGFEESMKFKKLTNAQRSGLSQIPNRRFSLWWSPTINRADVYIGYQVQLDLTGIFMHGKIPTLKISLIQIFRAHLWQKIHESVVMDVVQALDQHADELEVETVEKQIVHPRKSYKMNSSCADIVLRAAYARWPMSLPSFMADSETSDSFVMGGDKQQAMVGSEVADVFWIDVQLRWGDFDRHNSAKYARSKFLDYTSDMNSMYPSPFGLVIAIDLAYNTYSAYGIWFPGLKPLLRATISKIFKFNPALYILRERVRNALQLYSSEPTEPLLSSTNYGELFSDQRIWFLDDSAVYRVSVHKTFQGNVATTPINGAIFIFNPKTGQLILKVIHTSVWAGQKRIAQLARWKTAEEIGAIIRALPAEEHPNQVIVQRKGTIDALEVQLVDHPNIILKGSEMKLPFGAFIRVQDIADLIYQATEPITIAINAYDDWPEVHSSFVCFSRLVLILRAYFINPEKAMTTLRPDASIQVKQGHLWPSLTSDQWLHIETQCRNLILEDFCSKNGIPLDSLTQTEVRDIILGQTISAPSLLKQQAAEIDLPSNVEQVTATTTRTVDKLGRSIITTTTSAYETEQFISKSDWRIRAKSSELLSRRCQNTTINKVNTESLTFGTYILPKNLYKTLVSVSDIKTCVSAYIFGKKAPSSTIDIPTWEIHAFLFPPQLGSLQSCILPDVIPEHEELADLQCLGLIRTTSRDGPGKPDRAAPWLSAIQLASLFERGIIPENAGVNITCSITAGSVELTCQLLSQQCINWCRNQNFTNLARTGILPEGFAEHEYLIDTVLVLGTTYSGFTLVPTEKIWNYSWLANRFNTDMSWSCVIDTPLDFHSPFHRVIHFFLH